MAKIDKKAIVTELSELAKQAVSAAVADYSGLKVSEITDLRLSARKSGVLVKVYRNTLARRAVEGTEFACLSEALVGPSILLLSQNEPGAAARLLRDFSKDHEALQVRALALDGQLFGPDELKSIASLPTKDEAIAQLMSVMKAPITKFVRTVKEPVAKTVRVVAAIRDQKQAA